MNRLLRKARRGLSVVLALTMLLGTQVTLAAGNDSAIGGDNGADNTLLRENREGGLIGFEGEYALKGDGRMVTVIVEFVHQPAGLEEALAKMQQVRTRSLFNRSAAEAAAQQDQADFRDALSGLSASPLDAGGDVVPRYEILYTYTEGINGVAITLPDIYVEELAQLDCVFAVYPDEVYQLDDSSGGSGGAGGDAVVSDTDEEEEITQGASSTEVPAGTPRGNGESPKLGMKNTRDYYQTETLNAQGFTGKGVTVAVVDSGIAYDHPDFAGAFSDKLPNGEDPKPEDLLNGKFYGRNYLWKSNGHDANDPMDDLGHGSHCAGTIGGRGLNESAYATLGVAPEVTLVSYKVLNSNDSYNTTNFNAALNDAILDGCRLFSISLGSSNSPSPNSASTLMLNNLCIQYPDACFVFCAGNSGPNAGTLWAPSPSPFAITVANVKKHIDNAMDLTVVGHGDDTVTEGVTIHLARSPWNFEVNKINPEDPEDDRYAIDTSKIHSKLQQVIPNEDGSYKLVYLPTEDGKNYGTGTLKQMQAFLTAQDDPDALKGSLVVLQRGQAFDDTINILRNNEGLDVGGVIVCNTEGRDYSALNYLQGPLGNYIPVFLTSYEDGVKLREGHDPGDVINVDLTNLKNDDFDPHVIGESSKGPVRNTYEIKPDVSAVGFGVISTVPHDLPGKAEEGFEYAYEGMEGTSMATPHVAAFAALLRQQDPDIAPTEIKARLMNTAFELGDHDVFSSGAGMVDPARALASDWYATSINNSIYTRGNYTEYNISLPVASLNFGVLSKNVDGSKTLPVTVYGTPGKSFTLEVADNNSVHGVALQVPAETIVIGESGTVTFNVKATAASGADVGTYQGHLLLKAQDNALRMPFAVNTQDIAGATLLNPAFSFLQVPVLSNGKNSQVTTVEDYGSSDSVIHYQFVNDYFNYRWYIANDKGEYIGMLSPDWYEDGGKNSKWYYEGTLNGQYYPCTFDENYEPQNLPEEASALPEGHYSLVMRAKGNHYLDDDTYAFDFYVDNTLPTLTLTNYNSNKWGYKANEAGDELTLTGKIYDAGTAEMVRLGISDSVNKRLYGAETSQKDNLVVLKVGEDLYRSEIADDGTFTITLPAAAAKQDATLYYGDHFLPVGVEDAATWGEDAVAGFSPDKLSYLEVQEEAVDSIPYMKAFAYRAANLGSRELTIVDQKDVPVSDDDFFDTVGSGSGTTTTVTPSTDDGATTLRPSATVTGGAAKTEISTADANKLVDAAKKEKSSEVVISPALPSGAKPTEVSVTLPKSAVTSLVGGAAPALTVKTDLGNVTLPNESLGDIAKAGGDKAKVSVARNEDQSITFAVSVDGKELAGLAGGLKASIQTSDLNAGSVALLVLPDGTEQIIRKSAVKEGTLNMQLDGTATVKIEDRGAHFADSNSHWAAEAVAFVTSHGLFNGISDDSFAPDSPMTRSMLATVLNRLENEAKPSTEGAFSDVKPGSYYADAVAWAAEHNIVTGVGDGAYAPDQAITREQLAVMLYRYADAFGYAPSKTENNHTYPDEASVSAWAQDAMQWAVGAGLINGKDGGLAPQQNASRAEVATILQRFVSGLVG